MSRIQKCPHCGALVDIYGRKHCDNVCGWRNCARCESTYDTRRGWHRCGGKGKCKSPQPVKETP